MFALDRWFGLMTSEGNLAVLPELWGDPIFRMNDGACGPGLRFSFGTMAFDTGTHAGRMYRLNADPAATVVLDALTFSNGLVFTSDGRHAIYIDSASQQIHQHLAPADGSRWADLRRLGRWTVHWAKPDGLCPDRVGGIRVALWGGRTM